MKKLVPLAGAAAAILFLLPAAAEARPARCVVAAAGAPHYSGPCDFQAERGGSFTVTPARGRRFSGGVSSISLAIVAEGVGEVRGLTADGINSRWGEARRSTRDRACWVGADFSLCVY